MTLAATLQMGILILICLAVLGLFLVPSLFHASPDMVAPLSSALRLHPPSSAVPLGIDLHHTKHPPAALPAANPLLSR
jgi:hypothetical protein